MDDTLLTCIVILIIVGVPIIMFNTKLIGGRKLKSNTEVAKELFSSDVDSLDDKFKAAFIDKEIRFVEAIPTMGCSKAVLFVNPNFYLGLSRQQRLDYLEHEATHMILWSNG
jgi:hypothetical protein